MRMFNLRLARAQLALRYATLAAPVGGPLAKPAKAPEKATRVSHPAKVRSASTAREAASRTPRPLSAPERARWDDVTSSHEAAGRMPLARALLTDTNESAETIRSALRASPVSSAAAVARDQSGQILRAQRKAAGADVPPLEGAAAEIVRAYRKSTGTR